MLESKSVRDNFDWLQLLCQLSSVQTLYVFDNMTELISRALAYVDVGTISETLPVLRLLCRGKGRGPTYVIRSQVPCSYPGLRSPSNHSQNKRGVCRET